MDIPYPPPLETEPPNMAETSAMGTRRFFSTPMAVVIAFIRPPIHAAAQASLSNNANVRTNETIPGHHAPEKPRPSVLRGLGRAPGQQYPNQQKFVSDNLRAVLSAMTDNFGDYGKLDGPVRVPSTPTGHQTAWRERVNIERRQAQAYGDLFILQQPSYADYFPRMTVADANPQGY